MKKIKLLRLEGSGIAVCFVDNNYERYSVPQVKIAHERGQLQGVSLSVAADRLINEFKFDVQAFANRDS